MCIPRKEALQDVSPMLAHEHIFPPHVQGPRRCAMHVASSSIAQPNALKKSAAAALARWPGLPRWVNVPPLPRWVMCLLPWALLPVPSQRPRLNVKSLYPLVAGASSGPRQPLHPPRRAATLFHRRRLRRRDVRRAAVRRGRWREWRRRLRPGRRRRRGRQRGVRGAHRGAELAVLCAAGERRARQQWLRQLPPRQQRH